MHAAGLDRTSWDDVVARIPGFARAVAVDLPGPVTYDRSAVPALADHVAERMAALGLHRPHVVGHSLGAAVALELAGRVPVAAVTAFCPIGFHATTRAVRCGVKMRALMRFRRWLMSRLSARDLAVLAEFACQYVAVVSERLADIPVHLVWADQDRVVPRCDARHAAKLLPHAQHTTMVGCGHLVMRDDPDGTAAIVHASHSHLMRDLQRRMTG